MKTVDQHGGWDTIGSIQGSIKEKHLVSCAIHSIIYNVRVGARLDDAF
jgi:hypothetical protein